MNKDWADRFSHDVDNLLNEAGLSDRETPSTEYEEMLDVARLLTKSDFSSHSRVRHSLRRRLLGQIEDSLVTTVEIPGLIGFIKNLFRRNRGRPQLAPAHRIFPKRGMAVALFFIVALTLFLSLPALGMRERLVTLLAPLLPYNIMNPIGDNQLGVLAARWQFSGQSGISSPPLVVDDWLYVGSNEGYLYALDAETGQMRWRFQTGGSLEVKPALAAGVLYAASRDGFLYAVEATSGQELWHFKTDGRITTTPTVAGDTVYAGSEAGSLYALDAAVGREKWRFQVGGQISSSPVVAGGVVYFGSHDWHVYALHTATGQEKWRFKAQDWITAAPVIDESTGLVYVGSHDQYLYALDVATGQEVWRFNAGDNIVAAAALADDWLYFGSYDGYLYALETATGQERWRFWTGKAIQAVPVLVDGLIYIGSGEGYLYAVEATTGQARQQFDAGSQLYTTPVVSSETIYVTTGKGQLVAVHNVTGDAPATPLLVATTPQTYTFEAARFQFTPNAWFASRNEQDTFIRFHGRIVDEAGRPVNGFSIEADNGQRQLLSEPSGPSRRFPNRADGAWEIVIADERMAGRWWWLTIGRSECEAGGSCRFTRLSESVKVEVVQPDETIINADWLCHRNCQNSDIK